MRASDGSGAAVPLVKSETDNFTVASWSRDNVMIFNVFNKDKASDLWTMSMSGDRTPKVFLSSTHSELNGTFSPDGRWVAYQSNASGRYEILVRPFPNREPAQTISRDGGMYPRWRGDGKELFFLGAGNKLMTAAVKIAAAGVNYIDVYFREGRYPITAPFIIGQEASGQVSEVGTDVKDFKAGDRVAYTGITGAYAEYEAVPAERLVRVPAGITDQQAAAAMLQGMTAHYLVYSTYPLKKGETCLIHAAAGGLGLLLVQLAKSLGARVIGTVSNNHPAFRG
jgi:hypothetical protein